VTRLQWSCLPYVQAPPLTLYQALALRSSVFVLEQQCLYLDLDGADAQALIVAGSMQAPCGAGATGHPADNAETVVATARILAPGTRFAEPSIGRVCVSAAHRGLGIGRELVTVSIAAARRHHPGHAVRIAAQSHLAVFYESLGFAADSAPYLEDGIAHVDMLLAAAAPVEGTAA
jgi:ElaA protein